jgi:ribonuclease VapC
MVIDSSALIAILEDEPEASLMAEAIEQAEICLMSVVSLVETAIVIESRHGEVAGCELDQLIEKSAIEIMSVTLEQAVIARHAFRRYGKGKHPASLNFGDCFTYALAKSLNESLLFKGNDFNQTDIKLYLK